MVVVAGMHLRRAGEVLKLVEQIKSDNKEKYVVEGEHGGKEGSRG